MVEIKCNYFLSFLNNKINIDNDHPSQNKNKSLLFVKNFFPNNKIFQNKKKEIKQLNKKIFKIFRIYSTS